MGRGRLYTYCYIVTTRIIIIIMYIYHALINALSAHMIHIHLDMIFYTHVEQSYQKKKKDSCIRMGSDEIHFNVS